MKLRSIIYAAAIPLIAGATLASTAGGAFAATDPAGPGARASSSDLSAYFYNSSGQALGGPQAMGAMSDATVTFRADQFLARVTQKMHGENLLGKTVTITGHLDNASVKYQGYDESIGTTSAARVWFDGAGGVSEQSPLGFEGQQWWAGWGSPAVVTLSGTGDFTLTAVVDSAKVWSDWNGKPANQNVDLFNKAASHVQQLGLSFGGGYFFANGVEGTGSLTVESISISG